MRCFCARKPLLAIYGRDLKSGELFIHIRVYKQTKVYAEIYISANAEIKILCRECLRLHKVKIIQGVPSLSEEKVAVEFDPHENTTVQVADIGDVG